MSESDVTMHESETDEESGERENDKESGESETDEESGEDISDSTKISFFRERNLISEAGELLQETYSTDYKQFAKPIIFNHKRFSKKHSIGRQPNTRFGTSTDVNSLKKLFRDLKCQEPIIHKNKRSEQICGILQQVAQDDHSECACIIVVVLTHGDENKLFAYDKTYKTSALWQPFTKKFESNPTSAGKPKLFFIQACRGDDIDDAHDVIDASPCIIQPMDKPILKKIPRCADFFIAHSSFPGYMSVRNTIDGSWFVQTLCTAIEKYKTQLDLLSIMTIVKHDIAYNKTFGKDKKQIPCTETTLTKMLFLTKTAPGAGNSRMKEVAIDSTDSLPMALKGKAVLGDERPYSSDQRQVDRRSYTDSIHIAEFLIVISCVAAIFISWLLKSNVECHCQCGDR